MKTLVSTFALLLAATPALAADATHRLWGTGPAFWETPCGLPCFAMAEAAGVKPGEISLAELKRVETVADMQRLLDARAVRLAQKQGSAATGGSTPRQQ